MEQEALLASIRANPDDRTARLVYADWLDEHGNALLAEYIRAECAAEASTPGSPELTAALEKMLVAVRTAGRSLGGWEYGPELARIRSRLDRIRPLITEHESLRDPLPENEADVIDFELRHGVKLPGEYRAFLLHIGDEDTVRLDRPDLRSDDPGLRIPFPHSPETIARLVYECIIGAGGDAETPLDYDPDQDPPDCATEGCLLIGEAGNGGWVWVGVNGTNRGQIWTDGNLYGPWVTYGGRIAGFFAWYEEHLGYRCGEYGIEFED